MQSTNLSRAVERGFSRVEPSDNVLIAYAARDGTTASDGSGRNSPFTSSLLKNIETPGLEVRFLFANVRDDVMAETKQEQQPLVYGSLSKDMIYLNPPMDAGSANSQFKGATPAALPPKPPGPVVDRCSQPGATNCGWVGFRLQRVSEDVAEALKIKPARGALIAAIDQKGPAKPADILPGDVAIRFDGKEINDFQDLPRAVYGTTVGKEVDVVIIRDAKEKTKKVIVGRRVDPQPVAEPPKFANPIEHAMPSSQNVLGLDLAEISQELRARYNIKNSVKGVVVTNVESSSDAAKKSLNAGDVIVEVAQESVTTAANVQDRIDDAKKDYRKKTVLLLVSNNKGELRFVPLDLR